MKIIRIRYLMIALLFTVVVRGASAQSVDSLSHYLEIAARNNPGLKADFFRYKAALEKIPQAGAYSDPELDMGFFLKPMDIVGGKQVAEFQLMQMFPWFGTRKAARTEATHMAQMSFETFRETRNNLYLDLYTQWFILCSLQQKLINSRENRVLLTQLEQLALRRYSSPMPSSSGYSMSSSSPSTTSSIGGGGSGMGTMGAMGAGANVQSAGDKSAKSSSGGEMPDAMGGSSSAGMSEVLRVQMEIIEMDSNIESILSEIRAEKAKFNTLLNRPTDSELELPSTFSKFVFNFDPSKAMSEIDEQNPMLAMINEEGLAYKAKAEMDKKMGLPMFGIGIQYMLNKKTNDPMLAMGSMNGKDMVMPMVSISIPIYRGKYKAQRRESNLWWQASKENYASTYNMLESELYKASHLLEDAARKIKLYDKQTELAQTTYSLVIKEFAVGKSDLNSVIQVQRQLLDYQLKKSEAVASYNTMVASIQKLISFDEKEQNVNNRYYENE